MMIIRMKYHQRTPRDAIVYRPKSGRFAPRAFVALVTLGHQADKAFPKGPALRDAGPFSLFFGSVAETV